MLVPLLPSIAQALGLSVMALGLALILGAAAGLVFVGAATFAAGYLHGRPSRSDAS